MTTPPAPHADKKLGRHYSPDARDANYPMRLAPRPSGITFPRLWRYWTTNSPLDQGQTNQCVGYSWENWLRCSPIRTTNGPTPQDIYFAAQKVDEWPGEDYEGTSVRAGAQVLNSTGHIGSYLWATTPEELQDWVLNKGPVVVGTNWHYDMFNPDANARVVPTGAIAGGHAYLVTGYNRILRKYRCQNSWGANWGRNGSFYIKADDLHRLVFDQRGEACAAIEQVVVTP